MSDPTVQSLADQIQALTARLDDLTRGLVGQGADISRLGELTKIFSGNISVLESGKFASGIDVSGDLQVDGHVRLKGGDHLHVDAPALFVHGSDIILDGRSNPLDPTRFFRALVDMGNKLIVNFNGDYADGVVCDSGLVVNSQVSTQVVEVGAPSTAGLLRVKDASGGDAIGLDGASGRVSTRIVSIDSLESSQGSAGVIDVNTAQLRIHGGDLILDGRSDPLDPSRPYRALVDMGNKLIINFHGDYADGVVCDSELVVNSQVTTPAVEVGASSMAGLLRVKDQAGQDSVTIFGQSGHIHAKTVVANLRPPGADCAEQFEVAGDVAAEPGTLMIIGTDGVLEPCKTAYDARAAGVISGAGGLEPAVVLNEKVGTNRAAIALIGTVYCKVDAENAPISAGDLLTTSTTPGHGMKAVDPNKSFGAVIGKALKPLARGKGLIPVLVAPR